MEPFPAGKHFLSARQPHPTVPVFALLLWGAIFGTLINLPVTIGVNIVFGSIFAILALLLWQQWWGLIIGVIAALVTWVAWGHPWGTIIYVLEITWLSVATNRESKAQERVINDRIILHDLTFWLLIGIPLTFVFYHVFLDVDLTPTTLIALKQAVNGVLNTLMAVLMVLVYRLWIRPRPDQSVSIRTAIFAFGLLALLTPSLITWALSANQLVKVSQRDELNNLITIAHASRSLPDSFLNDKGSNFWIGRERIAIERERKGSAESSQAKILKANSNPALFRLLDRQYVDDSAKYVTQKGLTLLIPQEGNIPLMKLLNSYWETEVQTLNQDTQRQTGQGTTLANADDVITRVVSPAAPLIKKLQTESLHTFGLLGLLLLVGVLITEQLARLLENEIQKLLKPLLAEPRTELSEESSMLMPTLAVTAISEFATMISLINMRIRRINQLTLELARSRDQMAELSMTDALTGCRNRRDFHLRLGEEVARSRRSHHPLMGILIDIDHFKEVNDRYGHPFGDKALQAVAHAISTGIRAIDYCFRYGGEEFVILLIDCPQDRALLIAESLRLKVKELRISSGDLATSVSVSLGVASLNVDNDDADTFLARMDKALYMAKRRGRNSVVVVSADEDDQ
ncbi:diguanylate cyclase [Synechococcus sp. ATX 2A4]|uniref:GGDEF domain-containing protein n=1 Tax=Synechococcus sp. ATX 2A4 TaxID=2823727 RepID=UPI0020CDF918|nr:diguanylate cyclase [Synechococcus sp. ATX 2A4]MCP9884553.1 diguanylate cyclase [Synechococcus sp. ATX 2A4]